MRFTTNITLWWLLMVEATLLPQAHAGENHVAPPPRHGKYAWQPLFDGRTLANWRVSGFGGDGQVTVEKGMIVMEMGNDITGITYTGRPPKTNYEIELEGMRVEGLDFFCTTTFPVGDEPCSLVVGGWAGGIVGLSNVNGRDASENATTLYTVFDSKRWYRVRIRVTDANIECWIDDKSIIDVPRKGHTFGIRPEVTRSQPLGIATWRTTGAVRNVRLRLLPPERDVAAAVAPAPASSCHCRRCFRQRHRFAATRSCCDVR